MLIRLLILSAFVLLVHLVAGIFARDLYASTHGVWRRAAKDDVTDVVLSVPLRRRQMLQQHTVKRAASYKLGSTRRHDDQLEDALVQQVAAENKTELSNAKDNTTANTATTRKRRPAVNRATEPTAVSSQLPVAAALTMSDSIYNHFHPLDTEVPEDHIRPFLDFGKRLQSNTKTTYPASVTSSTNALDSVTISSRTRDLPQVEAKRPPVKPRLSEEEINEDMDVVVIKSIIEKNKVARNKPNSLLSLRTAGGYLKKQSETNENLKNQPETNENLVIGVDQNTSNDTKLNETKDIDRKRLLPEILGKKVVESNGRRKLVSVSRRLVGSNNTSTTSTSTVLPITSATDAKSEPETTSSSTTPTIEETPTQEFSSSNVVHTRTGAGARRTYTYVPLRKSNALRSTVFRHVSDNATEIDLSPVETNISSSTKAIDSNNSTITEDIKIRNSSRPVSIVEKYQSLRMAELSRGRARYPRLNATLKVDAVVTSESEKSVRNLTDPSEFTTKSPTVEIVTATTLTRHQSSSSEEPTATSTSVPVPTTKILSTAVVTSVSIKGAWTSEVTDIPPQETFPAPPQSEETDPLRNSGTSDSQMNLSTANDTKFAERRINTQEPTFTTAPGNATYSMIKDLIAEMNNTQTYSNTSVANAVPSSDTEHFVGVERPRPVFTNSSVAFSTSYRSNGALAYSITPPTSTSTETQNTQLPEETTASPIKVESPLPTTVASMYIALVEPSNDTSPDKGRALWKNTTSNPSTNIPIAQSSDKDFDLPLVKLYNNTSSVWGNGVRPTEAFYNVTEYDSILNVDEEYIVPVNDTSDSQVITRENSEVITTGNSEIITRGNVGDSEIITRGNVGDSEVITRGNVGDSEVIGNTGDSEIIKDCEEVSGCEEPTTNIPSPSVAKDCSMQNGTQEGCSSRPEEVTTKIPNLSVAKDCSEQNGTQEGCSSRPDEANTKIPSLSVAKDCSEQNGTQEGCSSRPEEVTTKIPNLPVAKDCSEQNGTQDGCSSRPEEVTTKIPSPSVAKGCSGQNGTQDGCSSRPREESVGVAETTSGLEMAMYILAGVCIIPTAVAAAFLVRCLLRRRRKVLDELDTYSEISSHRDGSTPASTKLPRLPPHMGWDQEKTASQPVVPDPNTRWEFPRSMLRLQTVLGQGNFGQVLKAEADDLSEHAGTTRLVAVKLIKEGATARERDDLLRELDIMKQLGAHPNVVTLLGCCTEQEPYLLIMEYVMYGKLLTFLRDHRTRQDYYNFSEDSDALTSRDLTVFGYCVARGMEYLVSKGIIHRDLAARNVLVDHNKLCKIADFGMSRSVRELGEVYEQRQTKGALPIRWMAPESLLYRVFTHKSDVWSFGILMWEIVTLGSTPYPAMGAREVMRRVREGYRLERPTHCRPELFRVISRCWNVDPVKRPDFSELKRELGTLVEDARQGGYVDLDRFAEYCGGRATAAVSQLSGGDPELLHM